MKTLLKITFLSLMMVSASIFAQTVTITGTPVPLEMRGEVYYAPDTYVPGESYNYVVINGTNRVCYSEVQPNLASLEVMPLQVYVGGSTVTWHCYAFSPEYFTVTTP